MRGHSTESGAILIHVGIAMVVLMAFSMFVIDHGVMWVSRGQAQNAADAGAMAGAWANALDNAPLEDDGVAEMSARRIVASNAVWGEAPAEASVDVLFDACPDGTASCLRVDVHRTTARGNPLGVFFGSLVGLESQGVRATATAQSGVANASDCLKPWAIPDKWRDVHDETDPKDGVWTGDDTFDTVHTKGKRKGQPLAEPDIYSPPTSSDPGTGFTVAADLGLEVTFKQARSSDAVAAGAFYPVRLPRAARGSSGGDDYRENIASCNGVPIEIGSTMAAEPGSMVGPFTQGIGDLLEQDPDAGWDPATNQVVNSCAPSRACGPRSPRLVPIPVFDTALYHAGRASGQPTLRIVNILGFFIDGLEGNSVVGFLASYPGLKVGSTNAVNDESSFLKSVILVR